MSDFKNIVRKRIEGKDYEDALEILDDWIWDLNMKDNWDSDDFNKMDDLEKVREELMSDKIKL